MTANRRPGFRLPWSADLDADANGSDQTAGEAGVIDGADAPAAELEAPAVAAAAPADQQAPVPTTTSAHAEPTPTDSAPTPGSPANDAQPGSADFMRDLVAAMRRVAEEARDTTLADTRKRADEQVEHLRNEAERRRADLHERAEADIAAVDEWVKAETERIRAEAERRVAQRRAQLEEQLAAEAGRADEAGRVVRERVAAYERELETYHARLTEVGDPAAFADAAKRMPAPPSLDVPLTAAVSAPAAPAPTPAATATPTAPPATVAEAPTIAESAAPEPPVAAPRPAVHPAEEPVLDIQSNGVHAAPEAAPAEPSTMVASDSEATRAEPVTTDVVVKGLGSFGAITGFRQTLAGVDGIDGVALSLGQTGEFVFRATHQPGFDVAHAIRSLEGEGARVEPKGDGVLAVTLDRSR